MNNVAIVGTCVNLSPEKKGEKTHEKSSTASMVNLKQRIFTASVMNLNVHGWLKFLTWYNTPAWIQLNCQSIPQKAEQVVGTSLENDFVNSFKDYDVLFSKRNVQWLSLFSNFHTCRKSGTGWPANAIAHKCKEDLAALFQGKQHSWSLAKKRFCNVLSKKTMQISHRTVM